MSVFFDRARGRWRYSFRRTVQGRRRRAQKTLPKGWSAARAEAFDRSENARLYAIASGIEAERLTLARAVQLYLEHRLPELVDRVNIARELRELDADIEGAALEDVAAVCRRYAARERERLAPATIHHRLSYLKAAVRFAYRVHDYGERDWTDRIVLPSVRNSRQIYLRLPEVRKLLKAFDDKEAAALYRIAFYTGLRWRAELLPRQPADLRRLDGERWLYVGTTKNGSPRMVPVHPAIARDLKRLPFTRPWHIYTAAFERARARVDMKHVRPHDLRHSLASEIISRGGTLPDVQAALHHESVQSSRRYAHLYPERVRRVLLGVGKRGRKKAA